MIHRALLRFPLFLITTSLPLSGLTETSQPRQVLEEVVVTAQKRSENIRDVPISITAMSEDFLNDAGITDVGELSKSAPNLVINATPYTGFVAMRGLGSGNNKGFERSVALVIDGIYYGRQDYLFEALADVQRVEVLRGPQGTLFGKNAIAGALNVTTGQPTPEFTGTVSAMGGTFNRERIRLAAGGPLIEDFLNVRVAYDRDKQDGLIKNTTPDSNTGLDPVDTDDALRNRDYELGRLRLHFPSLIDGMDINISATTAEIYSNGSATELSAATSGTLDVYQRYDPATEADAGNRTTSQNANQDTTRQGNSYAFQIDYELGEYLLTGIWGTSEFEKDHLLDADFGPIEAILLTGDDEYEQTSLELRIASPPGTFEYVAGLYYYESDFLGIGQVVLQTERVLEIVEADRNGGRFPLSAFNLLNGLSVNQRINNNRYFDQHTESTAVFGQATWNVSDTLALILGMRYSEEEKTADAKLSYNSDFSRDFFNTFLNEVPYDEQLKRKEYDFSPKLSVRYEFNDEVTFYATYATAFKAGGFNEQAVDNTNLEFEPEEATTLEAGAKMRFLDGIATLNVGLFSTEFDNLQVSLFNGTNFVVGNAASATSRGVEIEGQLIPTQWMFLMGSVAYLDARYDEFTNGQCVATSGEEACDLSGRELTRAPEWEATFAPRISLTKLVPWLNDNIPAEIGLGVDLSYRAHQFFSTDLDPLDDQGGTTEVGANLKISGPAEDWSLMLSARNANNKKIQAHGQDVPLQAGSHFATMEAKPRYYAEFMYRW